MNNDMFNLALHYHQTGNLQQAEALCRQILQAEPGHAGALQLLGLLAYQAGRHEVAIAHLRQALALNPADAGCQFKLAVVLMSQGQTAEAIACYRQVLRLNPEHDQAHNNLGNALKNQGQLAEAVACYRQALRCNPKNANAHYNLGNAFKDEGQTVEAAECYRLALACNPNHVDAHLNLSLVLTRLELLPEALEHIEYVLRINPAHETALCQRALLRLLNGEYEAGWQDYERVLQVNPGNEAVLWSRSLLRLAQGDFERGWQEFEYRWTQPGFVPRYPDRPRWDGSSLVGKTIFVHAEQGLGDTIQFIRYLPMVKKCRGTLLFGCQPALVKLCAGIGGVDQQVAPGAAVPPFDVHSPLLSLPGIFGTTLANIPAAIPYLRADPGLVTHWSKELTPLEGFKVGIVWQGSPKHKGDRFRSVPLTRFEALTRPKGVQVLSLQVGPGTEQLAAAPFPVTDLGNRFDPTSLADLAAVVMNLDLVVTVDTATAHVAGALGVPVWVILPLSSDWRWLRERSDSPWYPTMRLFRQKRLGHWDEVLEGIGAEVRALMEKRSLWRGPR
jgi:Flp pilus assembly protein TadD